MSISSQLLILNETKNNIKTAINLKGVSVTDEPFAEYPDKVRLNLFYFDHYSFIKDIQMIICTVLGKKMKYAEETI